MYIWIHLEGGHTEHIACLDVPVDHTKRKEVPQLVKELLKRNQESNKVMQFVEPHQATKGIENVTNKGMFQLCVCLPLSIVCLLINDKNTSTIYIIIYAYINMYLYVWHIPKVYMYPPSGRGGVIHFVNPEQEGVHKMYTHLGQKISPPPPLPSLTPPTAYATVPP